MVKKKSEEKVVKKPKKRGRRPKNNITVNENPVFTNETDTLSPFNANLLSELIALSRADANAEVVE